MIQKGKARSVDSADTVCVQEYHVHSNVDGLRVLPADFLSPRRHHFVHTLVPTSCVQGADIMMIIDRNEEAILWRRQLFRNNAQKNLSVTIMSDRLVNS